MEKQMSYSINTGNPAPKPTPVLLLREPVVFPYSLTPVLIESDCNKDALKLAMQQDRLVTVFYEVPDRRDLEDLEFPCRFATMHLQENDWGYSERCAEAGGICHPRGHELIDYLFSK